MTMVPHLIESEMQATFGDLGVRGFLVKLRIQG